LYKLPNEAASFAGLSFCFAYSHKAARMPANPKATGAMENCK